MKTLLFILTAIGIVIAIVMAVLVFAWFRVRGSIREQYRTPGPYL